MSYHYGFWDNKTYVLTYFFILSSLLLCYVLFGSFCRIIKLCLYAVPWRIFSILSCFCLYLYYISRWITLFKIQKKLLFAAAEHWWWYEARTERWNCCSSWPRPLHDSAIWGTRTNVSHTAWTRSSSTPAVTVRQRTSPLMQALRLTWLPKTANR